VAGIPLDTSFGFVDGLAFFEREGVAVVVVAVVLSLRLRIFSGIFRFEPLMSEIMSHAFILDKNG
jgi:hypothetical protein